MAETERNFPVKNLSLQELYNEILRVAELENCSLVYKSNHIKALLFCASAKNGDSYKLMEQKFEWIMWCITHPKYLLLEGTYPKYSTIRKYFDIFSEQY